MAVKVSIDELAKKVDGLESQVNKLVGYVDGVNRTLTQATALLDELLTKLGHRVDQTQDNLDFTMKSVSALATELSQTQTQLKATDAKAVLAEVETRRIKSVMMAVKSVDSVTVE